MKEGGGVYMKLAGEAYVHGKMENFLHGWERSFEFGEFGRGG